MYPRDFLDSYWRSGQRDSVFVAMPFHSEFTPIWQEATCPAIEQDQRTTLRAERVDASVLSGSIITDILDGIAHARVILADISIAQEGRWVGQRNGNVMYEVGLAHSARQSTEVLLVRSDDEEINFDLAGIRVHKYDRNDLLAARATFCQLVNDTLRQIDRAKGLIVQKAVDALDADALEFIWSWGKELGFHGPEPVNMGGALLSINKAAALSRLQSLGVVRCDPHHSSGKPAYYWTEFGKAVVAYTSQRRAQ
ncbi:MAG: hypothetical protein OEV15_00855 [Gallionella sp.]|nr:hypothetical protein [Gallionella sp.]